MAGSTSPSTSFNSGTSELMALLDQELQSDQSDGEQRSQNRPAETPDRYGMRIDVLLCILLGEQHRLSRRVDYEEAATERQAKRQRVGQRHQHVESWLMLIQ